MAILMKKQQEFVGATIDEFSSNKIIRLEYIKIVCLRNLTIHKSDLNLKCNSSNKLEIVLLV